MKMQMTREDAVNAIKVMKDKELMRWKEMHDDEYVLGAIKHAYWMSIKAINDIYMGDAHETDQNS